MEKNSGIDLNEINKLPDKELKRHFHEWLERDDIARNLQAKLRKDLFANFNKTTLGRKMFAQHVKSQGIILSPLILVLNTLIAEFLYSQKCHFSLSVFCTEVPYRNLLPDFENIEEFRFKKTELFEILEAINTKIPMELKKSICIQYFEKKNENSMISLLYILLKNVFENIQNPEIKKPEESIKIEPTIPENKEDAVNEETKINKDSNSTLNNSNLKFLNRYLILLSKKVQEMSLHLNKLENKEAQILNKTIQEIKTKKYENINRKLSKISDNLNLLSSKKYIESSSILKAIQQLAKQFETCATNFLNISKNDNKTYEDWINELKTSKSGRKFIKKIESSLRKTLETEKERISMEFVEKLETEKQLLKLKYKQKFAEHLNKASKSNSNNNYEKPQINENIDEKLKEFIQKHEQLLKRVSDTENLIKTATLERREFKDEVNQTEELKYSSIEKLKSPISSRTQVIPNLTPQLEGLAKSIAQQERNIDHIVFDAKLRVQELEHESIQLDRNFQNYLQRQKLDNKRTDQNASTIWQNYNLEKERLNKKCEILRNKPQRNPNANSVQNTLYDNLLLQIPQIQLNTELILNEPVKDATEISNFENPFRKLQNSFYLSNESKTNKMKHSKEENFTNSKSINNIQLKSNQKYQEEIKSTLINNPEEFKHIEQFRSNKDEFKSDSNKSPTENDKEIPEKTGKVMENPQNEKGLSQFIIGKSAKKLSTTSDNIFQIGSIVKDEEVNRILESSDSINSKKDYKLELSPRLPQPNDRSSSNLSILSGNISFENKSPDSSLWN